MTELDLRKAFDTDRPDFPKGTPFWMDRSFQDAAKHHPTFRKIDALLPDIPSMEVFDGQQEIEALSSSYIDHSYGIFFYTLARVLRPAVCVELGVLQGFSLLNLASALRDNETGTIQGFDLFEDYAYRHADYAEVRAQIDALGLSDRAVINRADAFMVADLFDSVDLLHVDLSNDGDTFRTTFESWASKVRQAIVFEGGSRARDQVDWMLKYHNPPVDAALSEIRAGYPQWSIFVLEPFPSITVALPAV